MRLKRYAPSKRIRSGIESAENAGRRTHRGCSMNTQPKALTSTGRVSDPLRRRLWRMKMKKITLEEARELGELTSHIVANLQIINDDGNDVEALLGQTNRIA